MGELERETADGFVWRHIEHGLEKGLITFKAVTLEEFNKNIRHKVNGPLPEFASTEDLWEWYFREYDSHGFAF